MPFSTTYAGEDTALVVSSKSWNTLARSPRERLILGGAGEPDQLVLVYEGLANPSYDWPATWAIGDEMTGLNTAGDWYVARVGTPEFTGPWISVEVICEGLYAEKASRYRWFSVITTVSGPAGQYPGKRALVAVEMDYIIVGGEPDYSEVNQAATPTPTPDTSGLLGGASGTGIGWYLTDLNSRSLAGRDDLWLVTARYDFTTIFSLDY